jgi:hypothetical protein
VTDRPDEVDRRIAAWVDYDPPKTLTDRAEAGHKIAQGQLLRHAFESGYIARAQAADYQARVGAWILTTFGPEVGNDIDERNHRFLEEALELVQATGCTASEAHQLVDYVFGRPVGDPHQEAGGTTVCLAALCNAAGLNLDGAAEDELARIWTKVEAIRAKHATKPKFSPLPGVAEAA